MSAPFSWPTVTMGMGFPSYRGDVRLCCQLLCSLWHWFHSRSRGPRIAPVVSLAGPLVPLPGPGGERGLVDQPQAPVLGGQRGPKPHRAVSAQVELTQPVGAVSRLDRRSAPITRLVHFGPPVAPVLTPPRSRPGQARRARECP